MAAPISNCAPLLIAAALGLLALSGCGEGDDASASDAGLEIGPVYALQTMIWDADDNATSYVALTDTPEFDTLSLRDAREFPGYAFVSPVDGALLVSDGERPQITRFEITPGRGWDETKTLSFGQLGLLEGEAGFERHWFYDEHTAFLSFDVVSRIVWDPSTLEITGAVEDSKLPDERDGLAIDDTFNRQPRIQGSGDVLKPFYYHDDAWETFAPFTSIAVIDPETYAEKDIIDVDCPSLEVASRDEDGNTYFSTWTVGPEKALWGVGPEPCVRRITADSSLDTAWVPDLSQWTEGRPVSVFRYWKDGKALATVLHTEEVEVDFDGSYDEDAAAELGEKYRVWLLDLDNETAHPLEGLDFTNSGFHWASFDDRTFLLVPYADWSRTKIYELAHDGTVSEHADVVGRVSEWVRVR